ncbi:MAG: hypothetical protein HQL90_12635 [Magnetococcales bacterium]|nr:hypothetical protein [Magnetococcales bacterium]
MSKYKFTLPERYAVWHCHEQRCWICCKPLDFEDATIDHFFPENLLANCDLRTKTLNEWGLPEDFNINGPENWLPCHASCNQKKGIIVLDFIPGTFFVLRKLMKRAEEVRRTISGITSNASKAKIFVSIFSSLENKSISTDDLQDMFSKLLKKSAPVPDPDEVLLLDGGYWVFRKDVVREGKCQCERDRCVGSTDKIHCYFRPELSPWVIKTGLYWKCYDEIVQCSRCLAQHKRGHTGKDGVCGKPYRDQESQTD